MSPFIEDHLMIASRAKIAYEGPSRHKSNYGVSLLRESALRSARDLKTELKDPSQALKTNNLKDSIFESYNAQ